MGIRSTRSLQSGRKMENGCPVLPNGTLMKNGDSTLVNGRFVTVILTIQAEYLLPAIPLPSLKWKEQKTKTPYCWEIWENRIAICLCIPAKRLPSGWQLLIRRAI